LGKGGKVDKLECVKAEFPQTDAKACPVMREVPESAFEIEAELVLIAVGFLHTEHAAWLKELGVEYDKKNNVKTGEDYKATDKVFCAGDMRRGQSLVVWAISEGRRCAYNVDKWLMGNSSLPAL
jgi:glutamate synthase (NADPH/NADH) small chain